jgi:hypothetical protein
MKAAGGSANLKISSDNSEEGCLNGSGFPSKATLLNPCETVLLLSGGGRAHCGGEQRPRKVLFTGKSAHPE